MPGSASRISGSAGCRAVPLLGRHHTLPPGRRRDRRQSGAAAACWAQRGAAAPLPALLPPLLRRRERRHQPPPRRHPHLEEAWAQARERDTKSHSPQFLAGVGTTGADGTGRARRLGSPSSVGTCTPLARVRAWVAEGRQLSAVGAIVLPPFRPTREAPPGHNSSLPTRTAAAQVWRKRFSGVKSAPGAFPGYGCEGACARGLV